MRQRPRPGEPGVRARRVVRKIFIIAAVIILAISAWIFYLNEKVLPVKIKSVIIKDLEGITKKRVLIGSVKFNIFKGLVLRDVIIRDEQNAVINVKEASCSLFMLPLLKKQVIVPRLTLESPEIFLARRADGSFNIVELFSGYDEAKKDFTFILRRVVIKKGDVNFHDLTLEPLFKKELKDFDADIYLDIPAKVRFDVKFNIQQDENALLEAKGEYLLPEKELKAQIKTGPVFPKDFERYYRNIGFSFPEGQIDSAIGINLKNGILKADIESGTKSLVFSREGLSAKLDARITAELHYNFGDKKMSYSGSADILDCDISGIETINNIDDVNGRVEFSSLGLSSENIRAIALGMPMSAKIRIDDFNNPVLSIDALSDVELSVFQDTLKEKFKIDIPADLEGPAKLRLAIRYGLTANPEFQMKGSLEMTDASVAFRQTKEALDEVSGTFEFTSNQLSWADAVFRYKGTDYRASGALTNFKTPGVQLKLTSENIAIDTVFAINDKLFNFSKFSGRYLNTTFALNGSLDLSDPDKKGACYAEMTGVINLDPEDLKEPLKKFKDKLEKIKPKGDIRAEIGLKGDIKDLKSCWIDAKLSSEGLSLYDLKMQNTTLNYSQKNGSGDILFMRSFLYGGSMGLTGKIAWASKDVPYSLDANIENIKIEKLKSDTAFKDKDISGSVNMQIRLNGFSNDIARLKGRGRAVVSNGKLWQLNLFRGLGVLLFSSDFSNVIFKEGHGDIIVEDKAVFVDNFDFKSGLVDLYGSMKLGFDKSVSGSVKAEFSDEALDTTAQKNIVTALGQYSVIQLSGTLNDPKYKVRPDVGSIAEGIAEQFLNR